MARYKATVDTPHPPGEVFVTAHAAFVKRDLKRVFDYRARAQNDSSQSRPYVSAIVWFRRDLRVHEHPALRAALDAHNDVVPVFCLNDRLLHGRHASGPRTQFLLEWRDPIPCLARAPAGGGRPPQGRRALQSSGRL